MLLLLPDEYLQHHVLPLLCLQECVKIDSAIRGSPMAVRIKGVFENYILEERLCPHVACLQWLCIHQIFTYNVCVISSVPYQYLQVFSHTVYLDVSKVSTSVDVESIVPHCRQLQYLRSRHLDQKIADLLMQNCPALQGLWLNLSFINVMPVISSALISLSRAFPNMSQLGLSNGRHCITDDTLRQICMNCRSLLKLDLGWCYDLGDTAMRAIAQYCPLIRKLKLPGLRAITDTGANELFQALPELRMLNVSGCRVLTSEAALSLARWCPKLTHVNLSDTNINVSCLVTLLHSCTGLEEADLSFLRGDVNDEVFSLLSDSCPRLKKVSFCATQITDAGVLTFVSKCINLTNLDISACEWLTDQSLQTVASYCPQLNELNCHDMPNLHCDAVLSVVRSCPLLRWLNIAECYTLLEEDLDAIHNEAKLCNSTLIVHSL